MKKHLNLLASLFFSVSPALAKTVYLECAWDGSLSVPSSQTVNFLSGSTVVQSAVVSASSGWRAAVTVNAAFGRARVCQACPGVRSVTRRDDRV